MYRFKVNFCSLKIVFFYQHELHMAPARGFMGFVLECSCLLLGTQRFITLPHDLFINRKEEDPSKIKIQNANFILPTEKSKPRL